METANRKEKNPQLGDVSLTGETTQDYGGKKLFCFPLFLSKSNRLWQPRDTSKRHVNMPHLIESAPFEDY